MRSTGRVLSQILLLALGLALVGGLVGGLIAQFATSHGFLKGVPYGIIVTAVIIGFVTAQSGSPTEMAREGRQGTGLHFADNPALPQAPYQFVLGGLLAFGLGIALLALA